MSVAVPTALTAAPTASLLEYITSPSNLDLLESASTLIDALLRKQPMLYIQPTFEPNIIYDVTELLFASITPIGIGPSEGMGSLWAIDTYTQIKSAIENIVKEGLEVYYRYIAPARSSGNTFIRIKPNITKMREKLNYLTNIPQPDQRTTEWYEFRYRYLTASSIWKAFISESTKNQLIFDKCKPLNIGKYNTVCMDSPMHWGHKYEPLSIKIYEQKYSTQVGDFGCIPHKTVEFLAASPDGINILDTSPRYGRMVEVKNIVNRDITGIPKMEYWIQMQVQMEVCDLNECDFLETRFTEYPDVETFEADADKPDIIRGMMMLFMQNGQPMYEYAALDLELTNAAAVQEWQDCIMNKNSKLTWIKTIYWKLDELSCVLVLRNKVWFKHAEPILRDVWQTIEREKIAGYTHRGPKKNTTRVKKVYENNTDIISNQKCFITIDTASAAHASSEVHADADADADADAHASSANTELNYVI